MTSMQNVPRDDRASGKPEYSSIRVLLSRSLPPARSSSIAIPRDSEQRRAHSYFVTPATGFNSSAGGDESKRVARSARCDIVILIRYYDDEEASMPSRRRRQSRHCFVAKLASRRLAAPPESAVGIWQSMTTPPTLPPVSLRAQVS